MFEINEDTKYETVQAAKLVGAVVVATAGIMALGHIVRKHAEGQVQSRINNFHKRAAVIKD